MKKKHVPHKHRISKDILLRWKEKISPHALTVLARLKKAGYPAYLVGGCVRDLLFSITPKDFDVVTQARPEQIRKIFKNCLLIGRRFRLAHVRFPGEIIEVATFRAHHGKASKKEDAVSSEKGVILRDNVYGTLEEDAFRRDFTINALYFDVLEGTVLDYCQGMQDIEKKHLKIIGDPSTRFQEDPIRLLRAVRLAAKLGITLEKTSEHALRQMGYLLHLSDPARLFEETMKLFLTGLSEKSFQLLLQYDLLKALFPATAYALASASPMCLVKHFLTLALKASDQRISEGKPINPAFLVAVFLWHPFKTAEAKIRAQRLASLSSSLALKKTFLQAFYTTLQEQKRVMSIPKRFYPVIQDIWRLQPYLENARFRLTRVISRHRRFRAAYDFLGLRHLAGENISETAFKKWQTFYATGRHNEKSS